MLCVTCTLGRGVWLALKMLEQWVYSACLGVCGGSCGGARVCQFRHERHWCRSRFRRPSWQKPRPSETLCEHHRPGGRRRTEESKYGLRGVRVGRTSQLGPREARESTDDELPLVRDRNVIPRCAWARVSQRLKFLAKRRPRHLELWNPHPPAFQWNSMV